MQIDIGNGTIQKNHNSSLDNSGQQLLFQDQSAKPEGNLGGASRPSVDSTKANRASHRSSSSLFEHHRHRRNRTGSEPQKASDTPRRSFSSTKRSSSSNSGRSPSSGKKHHQSSRHRRARNHNSRHRSPRYSQHHRSRANRASLPSSSLPTSRDGAPPLSPSRPFSVPPQARPPSVPPPIPLERSGVVNADLIDSVRKESSSFPSPRSSRHSVHRSRDHKSRRTGQDQPPEHHRPRRHSRRREPEAERLRRTLPMSSGARPAAGQSNGRVRPREGKEEDAIVNNNSRHNVNGSEGEPDRKKEDAPAPKPGPKLAQTKIQLGMRLKRWMIVSRIGAGSFGETFTAIEVDGLLAPLDPEDDPLAITADAKALLENLPEDAERKEVCIKVEQENKNVLRLEALALKKVQPCPQVVRYLGSGCTSGMNFLVMEKLGPNLAELRRRSPHGTFNIYTTLKAGISCLQAIRGVHEQGLVHRDIKPSNFVTGLPGTEDQAVCFIIDFGLARRYRRSNGEIRPPRENAGFRGTSRYASVTSHHHQELGRVDDLWSLLFMLVEFATGTLPWRKYKDKDDIGRCKEESITPHLVRNLPREFQPFLAHLQTLRYEDEPDYELLLALMHRSLERRGYPRDKPVDWELDPSMIEAADNELAAQPQQVQAPKALAAAAYNGQSSAPDADGGASRLTPPAPLAPTGSGAYDANRITPGRMSSSQPVQKPPSGGGTRTPQQQQPARGGSSSGSEGAADAPKPQGSNVALRVSDVEVSYQRSQQQNEESRSNLGLGSQQGNAAAVGRHSVPQTPQAVSRLDDGSETPAVQASSSGEHAGADEEEDADGREFSPREQDDEAAAASLEASPSPAATKPDQPPRKNPDHGKTKVTDVLSPSPPAPGGEQSLDAIEQNAINDPPPPPPQRHSPPQPSAQAQQQGKKPPSGEHPSMGADKTPKTKTNCKCAVM